MNHLMKLPINLEPQMEGGWTITSPIIPELITEIDDLKDLSHVLKDAVDAIIELYRDMGKELPVSILEERTSIQFESVIPVER